MKELKKKCLIGIIALTMFLSMPTYGASMGKTVNNIKMASLYEQLDLVLQNPEYQEYIKNDNKWIIGNPIHSYELTALGFEKTQYEMYPLFYGEKLVFFVLKYSMEEGEIYVQITDCLIKEMTPFVGHENVALLYDINSCYCISTNFVKKINKYERITSRKKLNDKDLTEFRGKEEVQYACLRGKNVLEYTYLSERAVSSSATIVVPYITQNPYENICWAASVACVGNYLTSYSHTATYVAQATFGSTNWNRTNTLYGALGALSSVYGITYGVYSNNSAPSDSRIYNNISSGYPLWTGWIYSVGSTTYSHSCVIRGISTGSYVYVMDPAYGFVVANKISGTYKYVSTVNGETLKLYRYGAKVS